MAFPYVKQTWTDGSGGATPLSAARLGVMEQGIYDAHHEPAVQAFHSATQNILNNTMTTVACNSENFDFDGLGTSTMHDNVTNNSRLTCRVAGIYLVTASNVSWPANPVTANIEFLDTGGTVCGEGAFVGDWRVMGTTCLVSLSVNDYMELRVRQISGGTLALAANFEFGMVRVA